MSLIIQTKINNFAQEISMYTFLGTGSITKKAYIILTKLSLPLENFDGYLQTIQHWISYD